jgi:putative membrane protein insertion efficiency factor
MEIQSASIRFRRETLISLSISIALLVLYTMTRTTTMSVGIQSFSLPEFQFEQIEHIEISGAQPLQLKKEGTTWFVQVDDTWRPADEASVQFAASTLMGLSSNRSISQREDKYQEYGVADDNAVRVQMSGTQMPKIDILLGERAKSGGSYVRVPNQKYVFVAQGNYRNAFSKDLSNWRRKKILTIQENTIESVAFSFAQEFRIAKDAEKLIIQSEEALADNFEVDEEKLGTVVQNIATLRASRFKAEEEKNQELGFFVLKHANGEIKLRVSSIVDSDDVIIIQDDDPYGIEYILSAAAWAKISTSLDDFRSTQLARLSPIEKIELQTKETQLTLVKRADAWFIDENVQIPAGVDLESEALQSFAAKLITLQADHYVSAGTLNKEKNLITLRFSNSTDTQSIRMKLMTQDNNSQWQIDRGDGLMFSASESALRFLQNPYESLKKKKNQNMNMPAGGGGMNLQDLPPAVYIVLIRVYQRAVSPYLPAACRYQPSCSQYAIEAIERFGAWRGGMIAIRRILRCHPFASSGYDPVPVLESVATGKENVIDHKCKCAHDEQPKEDHENFTESKC